MCRECWEEEGCPSEITGHTAEFVTLVRVLYRDHPTGGALHANLDDWNVDGPFTLDSLYLHYEANETNLACLEYVLTRICELANAMTPQQRMAALAVNEGWLANPAPIPDSAPLELPPCSSPAR